MLTSVLVLECPVLSLVDGKSEQTEVTMLERRVVHPPSPKSCAAALAIMGLMLSACGTEEVADPTAGATSLLFTESVRIGDEAAGDTVYFDLIWDTAVDSEGRILVADNTMHGFRVFTSEGLLSHEIGHEGEGPGEFGERPLLHVGPQDSVYAFDLSNDRLSVFSPGDYILAYTVRLSRDEVSTARPTGLLAVMPDRLVVEYEHIVPRGAEDDRDGLLEVKLADRSGRIERDSLVLTPSLERTTITDEDLSIPIPFPRLFGRESFLVTGSDGLIYYGWNEDISIYAVTFAGGVVHQFTVSHASVPVTSAEKDVQSAKYLPEWQEQLRRDMPDTKPAYNAMVSDDEGRLWLQLSWPSGIQETEWIVVNGQTGAVEAKATLPVHVEIVAVRHGNAYGTLDEDESIIAVWGIGQQR